MTDIVYVLTNKAMPGLVKIECTVDNLAARIRDLYGSAPSIGVLSCD